MASMSAKRKYLSVEDKVRVIREIESGKKKTEVCREFDLVYQTVLSFWKNRDKIIEKFEQLQSKSKLDERIAASNNIDEELLYWVRGQRSCGGEVNDTLLKARAEEFAAVIGYDDFVCSDEWLEGFKCRHSEYFPEVEDQLSNLILNENEENSLGGQSYLTEPDYQSHDPDYLDENQIYTNYQIEENSEQNFQAIQELLQGGNQEFNQQQENSPLDFTSDDENLQCLECNLDFPDKDELYTHLLDHVSQPAVTLTRVQVALAPIKITLKSTDKNNFEIISSDQSPTIADQLEDSALGAEDGIPTVEEIIEGEGGDQQQQLQDAVAVVESEDLDGVEEGGEGDVEGDAEGGGGDGEANISFSPNYLQSDGGEMDGVEEDTPDIAGTTDDDQPADKTDYASIPGAEPTPPPEPSPEYPKIRIKTGLLKESLTITEITDDNPNGDYNTQSSTEYHNSMDSYNNWATPSLEDPLRLPDGTENDSSILSNLFNNNNDRAKDLGFTTSDTEFISMDAPRSTSNALAVYSSSNSMVRSNPLDSLTNLPMQQLAQQVSRLQPNSSNGMHQQNVLINIQQFPQAPPQPHGYQPHMYPPHPPQPMYHQPYQYQPPNPPMYYPQAPGYHMPPPPRPQLPPQMAPPGQQMPQQQPMHNGQPPPYRQPQPRQQQPMPAPRQPIQPAQRGGGMQPRPGMQPRVGMPMGGPRQYGGPRQAMAPRQRAPMMRGRGGVLLGSRGPRPRMPMQNGQAPQQQNGPRMIKRSPESIQALQAKRKKMDVLVPDKHDDADCQVIAVQPKNTGLPQIQSIQGNAPEPADNSVMHLSDSITLSVRNPPPKPPSPKKSDAKDVANILATRGITVTATQKAKEATSPKPTSQSPEPPVAINLNSSVCIIPTQKNQPQTKTNDKLTTVDLTDDTVETTPAPQTTPKPIQQKHQQQQNKVLPFQCDLCPAKYPNSLSLNRHRQSFHKTGSMCDYGIPLIDIKTPGVVQRLATLGIHNYIPLPGANPDSTFALPIINTNTYKNGNLNSIGATSVLTLGPVRMLPKPPAQSK